MGKYSSVGFLVRRGTSKTTKVRRDSDGQFGGVQTEHWDGRLDANVVPESVELKVAVGGDE